MERDNKRRLMLLQTLKAASAGTATVICVCVETILAASCRVAWQARRRHAADVDEPALQFAKKDPPIPFPGGHNGHGRPAGAKRHHVADLQVGVRSSRCAEKINLHSVWSGAISYHPCLLPANSGGCRRFQTRHGCHRGHGVIVRIWHMRTLLTPSCSPMSA